MSDDRGVEAYRARVAVLDGVEPRIADAFVQADRVQYVLPDDRRRAYTNSMLPLPCGQAMERIDDAVRALSALECTDRHRVLEIGTGSGHLTEVLARVAGRVVTIDRYRSLLDDARERHADRDVSDVTYHQRDAFEPGDLAGSFDRIISTVAFDSPPRQFVEHLVAEGVLIAPIGPKQGPQTVMRLSKIGSRFEKAPLFEAYFPPAEEGLALAL